MNINSDLQVKVAIKALESAFDNIALLYLNSSELEVFQTTQNSLLPKIYSINERIPYDIKKLSTCLSPDEVECAIHDMSLQNIQLTLELNGKFSHIFNVLDNSGSSKFKLINLSYFDKEQQIVLVTCSDVSVMQETENEQNRKLKIAVDDAERSNNIKTEFLSRMSHDIRTPLNGIIGMTELATENLDRPDKIQHYLERIQFASKYLLSIIRDILDMSRIETGKTLITSEPFHMHQLVDDVFEILEEEASNKRLDFTNSIADNLYYGFIGDSLHIKQVLVNLLSNSIKYTNQGGRVSLYITSDVPPDEGEICQVTFSITDSGVGISEEFQKHMFEAFEQAHNDTGTYSTGAGLGLSIVKKLVELMNGTISVTSQLGLGSTFTVVLPLIKNARDGEEPKIIDQSKQSVEGANACAGNAYLTGGKLSSETIKTTQSLKFNGQRILIVEDNEINMEIVRTMLSSGGLKYDSAWNGQECVDLVKKAKPGYYSAILMDIRMPVMDGREATRRIRLMPRNDTKTLPIIALSADAFADEVKASQSAGMDDYIIKPVNKNELLSTLKKFV